MEQSCGEKYKIMRKLGLHLQRKEIHREVVWIILTVRLMVIRKNTNSQGSLAVSDSTFERKKN